MTVRALVIAATRALLAVPRPTAAGNRRRLRRRGESVGALVVRPPVAGEIPALARLHVETWNATYPFVRRKPSVELREAQWREAFGRTDGSWFAFVVERPDRRLVGFAKGIRSDHPEFQGELSKIYLLRDYQRLGLGSRLMGHVSRRFVSQGISSMVLFAEPSNPSCGFYEALGAERLFDDAGRFHGAYGWRDLNALARRCPIDP